MLKVFCAIEIILLIIIPNPIWGNRFAIRLIKTINNHRNGNFVIAPLSVSHALSQLYLANEDHIDFELHKSLRFRSNDVKYNIKVCRDYYARALTADLRLATRLFVPQYFNATERFVNVSNQIHASVQNLDYSKPAKAAMTINLWISKEMKTSFGDLVHEDDLSIGTDLLSISGVFFKPMWRYPFFSRWKKPFTVRPPEGKPHVMYINTMYTSARFATFNDRHARGIFLPLDRTSVGILIIVPRRQGTPKRIMQRIDRYYNLRLRTRKLSLFLPMFKIILGTELTPTLKRLGIQQIFEGYKYIDALGTKESLSVDIFKTKTVIEFTSDRVLIEIEDPEDQDEAIFEVNRPFVFVIKDRSRIFAAGRVDSLSDMDV